MAEEDANPAEGVPTSDQNPNSFETFVYSSMAEEDANPAEGVRTADQNPNSFQTMIVWGVDFGAMEPINISTNAEISALISEGERDKALEYADELMARGSEAAKERDHAEATDCYSRALEIRVALFGELAPECVNAYYKYGCALLYKAQDEADPLGSMPKEEGASIEDSNNDGSVKSAVKGECSAASISNNAEQDGSVNGSDEAPDKDIEEKDEGEEERNDEELADGDEDESDLDLAWKMLDVARAIIEKQSVDTMEKVDILSALAEVAMEREDVETSFSDYLKALSILEQLVEPDSRLIAELNFRICLCLEIGSKPEEAIPYCQKAISVCKSRVERLTNEVKNLSKPAESSNAAAQIVRSSSTISQSGESLADREAEIETLAGLSGELEKKLEDLQQFVANPKSILSDILGMTSTKARAEDKTAISAAMSSSQMGVASAGGGSDESTTVSTAHTNSTPAVTHLGVVGRGVKRAVMSSVTEYPPAKKPATDPSSNNGDGSTS